VSNVESAGGSPGALFLLHRRLRAPHDFSRDEVAVAFAVAGFMRRVEGGRLECWPSVQTIAEVCGMSPRMVERALRKQRDREVPLFKRIDSVAVGRQRRLNRYRLVEDPASYAAEVAARSAAVGGGTREGSAAVGGGTREGSAAVGGGTQEGSAAVGGGTQEDTAGLVPPVLQPSAATLGGESRQNDSQVPPPATQEDSGRSEVDRKIAREELKTLRDALGAGPPRGRHSTCGWRRSTITSTGAAS
jgi:hypothetical protein